MTIYKFSSVEKKPEKKEGLLDVVAIPLTDEHEGEATPAPALMLVQRRRSRLCTNVVAVFLGLIVLAAGIIGGIFLYNHLVHKKSFVCGVNYTEQRETEEPESSFHYMEETLEIPNDHLEKIEVPKFDECEKSLVLHDFTSNYTAIVDKDNYRCFIIKLNRTLVAPPRDMMDLIWKLRSGYYMPNAEVVRQKYRVMMPPLENLSKMGPYIEMECDGYNTFKLKRMVGDRRVWKRSAENEGEVINYGFCAGQQNEGKLNLAKFEITM